jgi:RNA polymerase sigma factor (sigma-70 family)
MSQGRQATTMGGTRLERGDSARAQSEAARKRAAIEMIAEHEGALKRTARRYSFDAEDAEDAYQRALEIVLTKAPTTDPRELIRWTQTVTKHEALALRQSRERLLGYGGPKAAGDVSPDLVALIPAAGDGPEEQVERREAIARSREALRALKPAELRALSLLAEGYSYVEIGELTGFSQTKINRVLAEGRDRFRSLVSSSEDGSRCRQLRPLLSAFCDGEASERDAETVREHLRACGRCRSTMRAYRAAPRIAVALAPVLPPSRSLLGRAHDLVAGLVSRLPGIGGAGDSAATQIAVSGGSR